MSLFKFREVNTNNLSALANNQLWFSSLNDFNDPFEGAHIKDHHINVVELTNFECKIKDKVGVEEYNKILSKLELVDGNYTETELFQKIAEHDLDKFISIVHNSKVICFSMEDETKNPLTNNLMWSHYANGLRGFCLVFNGDELLKDLYKSTKESMRPIVVEYKDKPNILKLNEFIHSEGLYSNSDTNFVQKVTETIATKSTDWEYEKEFRVMSLNQESFHNYSPSSLKEIVIGDKMPEAERNLLLKIVSGLCKNILIKTARLQKNSYKIEIV
ncbi:DUF2971 domain-containing protein [Pseudoalteromonas sp. APM04]|uniref:DUF2971 domain-containing protein n=1 Tax=Pseudoalteromonas sp. APM04 TaxID=2699396 RepID=UPI001FB31EB0|nr:DUF2971 domain-containing protein [Pseudoalteromonas sp. APM04]UOB74930.1 DUF2971 domain-containing protein [Pseudoalteromonas sp. APM04]